MEATPPCSARAAGVAVAAGPAAATVPPPPRDDCGCHNEPTGTYWHAKRDASSPSCFLHWNRLYSLLHFPAPRSLLISHSQVSKRVDERGSRRACSFSLFSPSSLLLPQSTPQCTVLILGPLPPFAFSSSVDEFERERFSWRPPPQCRTSVSQAVTSLQRAVRPSVRPIVARSFVRLSVRLFVHPHEARELATAAAAADDDVAVVHFEGRSPHS